MSESKPTFSRTFNEKDIRTEIIVEMIIDDGWATLEECLKRAPKALEILGRHADAALRVMKRVEERENNLKPSEH